MSSIKPKHVGALFC